MDDRSTGGGPRSTGSSNRHGTRYAVALVLLVALTLSSFLIMRAFVLEESLIDETLSSVEDLRANLADHQIGMRDLVVELRADPPDEFRLRGLRRALQASAARLVQGQARVRATLAASDFDGAPPRILDEPPYSLAEILKDMGTDTRAALGGGRPTADDEMLADPREEGFLNITDAHAKAARLATDRLLVELRDMALARKATREAMHAWLGWATVLVLLGEAMIIFWPLVGTLGREARRADEATSELARLARHDTLTGLLNRASLIREAELAIAGADPRHDRLAVMLIDLDRFKPINDMFGHAAGDGVLVEIARRLQASLRPRDIVARLGGDEYVVVLPRSGSDDDVRDIGLRINRTLAREMEIEGHRLRLGASIGCAFWPEDATDVDGLLSSADLAMYQAKRNDSDAPVFFDEGLRSDVALLRSEEADLRQAIAEDQLQLFYQPIVSLDGDEIHGFEALLRWDHPTDGLLRPDRFLPTAERAGLMSQLTSWVLDRACRQQADWETDGLAPGLMSINVPEAFLTPPDAIDQVLAIAARRGIATSSLALEISERVLTGDDHAPIAQQLEVAHRAGLRIALDEFGLGQASLIHLRKPGIDILKIDHAFVRDLSSAPENVAIVGAMIELGRILDKQIVVEGIESAEQAALLAISEKVWVQGFLYAQPLEIGAATRFLGTRRAVAQSTPRRRNAG